MIALLARILFALALLVQGMGAIAAEIGSAVHPRCRMAMAIEHGKPAKMPCHLCDECTMPSCSTGCMAGVSFLVPQPLPPLAFAPVSYLPPASSSSVRSLDSSPPLRPPIA
jgi:hypothetical protein